MTKAQASRLFILASMVLLMTAADGAADEGALRVAQRYVGEDVGAWEPPLAFARDGSALYVAEFLDGPTGRDNVVFRSRDQGESWQDVSPIAPYVGADANLHTDPRTGRVYALVYDVCAILSWTDDAGDTWFHRGPVCDPLVTDHPTLWTGPAPAETAALHPSAVYLCYNANAHHKCQRSLDGGLTFAPIAPPFDPAKSLRHFYLGTTCEPWIGGRGHANPITGTLFLGSGRCLTPEAAISRDHGLTWERATFGVDVGAQHPREFPDPQFATDAAGTTYAFWIGADDLPYLSSTADDGRTWSRAVAVGAPGLTGVKFPAIAAGDAGRLALGYVGTTSLGGFGAADMTNHTWHAFLAIVLDADGPSPILETTTANALHDPIRRGECRGRCSPDPTACLYGLPCAQAAPAVGMGDYLFVEIDPTTGRAWMTFNDECTGACALPGADADTPYGGDRASVGVQVSGPRLVEARS